ncbi:CbiX/SirB N-terminal domain-containing protein [Magnetospirillum fulvum]|uniref:Sirohydrochlorin cobaltochelatase n=1 Tax=Magnetospirillum fulvum TaxID=1082 RepID=A0A1H6HDV2_MAGFU|nr:CbiX/SirB N-terminal domain-containing protein [Magnetospirillum fulvum]SEH32270.1 sirohydrochlorin cobaltochelatase [Magnetospirillum fulvum]
MSPDRPALVLVGHGSARHPEAGAPLLALAETVRLSAAFASVEARFLKQEPRLGPPAPAPLTVIVPVLTGGGAFAETRLAEQAGLDGPQTLGPSGRILLTPPVGAHPGFAALVERLAEQTASAAGLDPAASVLLLIGHGATRPEGAAGTAQAIAAHLKAHGRFADVAALFLEQEPFAADWPERVGNRSAVAVPLLLSQGGHVRTDLPALFKARPDGENRVVLAAPPTDPVQLAEIVLALVAEAIAQAR